MSCIIYLAVGKEFSLIFNSILFLLDY